MRWSLSQEVLEAASDTSDAYSSTSPYDTTTDDGEDMAGGSASGSASGGVSGRHRGQGCARGSEEETTSRESSNRRY